MSVSAVRITYFQADRIACQGSSEVVSPYRVTTYRGPQLGLLGAIPAVICRLHELRSAEAANSVAFDIPAPGLIERLTLMFRKGCRLA